MTDRTPGRIRRWVAASVAAVALLVGSAIPLPPRYNPDFGRFGPDKLLHLAGHAGFAAAVVAAVGEEGSRTRSAVLAISVSTVYGVVTESVQESVPGREFEEGDVVAGFVGSILGALFWRQLRRAVRGFRGRIGSRSRWAKL